MKSLPIVCRRALAVFSARVPDFRAAVSRKETEIHARVLNLAETLSPYD
jgi:hypothetical protein